MADTKSMESDKEAIRRRFIGAVAELKDRIEAGYEFQNDSVLRLMNEIPAAITMCDFVRVAEVALYIAAFPKEHQQKIIDHYCKGEADGNKG